MSKYINVYIATNINKLEQIKLESDIGCGTTHHTIV